MSDDALHSSGRVGLRRGMGRGTLSSSTSATGASTSMWALAARWAASTAEAASTLDAHR